MINPLEFFDAIYCITTDINCPRAQIAAGQFEDLGLCPEFVTGKVTYPYQLGCLNAHRECIELAVKKKCKNVLIFEDDVTFINYDSDIISECLTRLPPSWEMFFLGGIIIPRRSVDKVTKHLIKTQVQESHAYALNESTFDTILGWNPDPEAHITDLYRVFKECYSITPPMAIQVDKQRPFRTANALHSNLHAKYIAEII